MSGSCLQVFSKRLIRPELMDHAEPEEARENLADLVRINRRFGGHSVLKKMFADVRQQNTKFSVLDIGAASGDSARLIQDSYPKACITSLDLNSVNLEAAPFPKIIANAFALPFLPDSFDYVICSLFLHHFEDEQVVTLLRSFHCVARRALLVSDLERHILPYCFLPATRRLLGWKRLTVHDGVISVRASFRADELLDLSKLAGIENARVATHRPAFRISLIARKDHAGAEIT